MSNTLLFNEIENKLTHHNLDSAMEDIMNLECTEPKDFRMKYHYLSKVEWIKNNLAQAEKILSSIYTQYGSHVGVLADLALINYQRGQFDLCREYVFLLETEFLRCKDFLSKISFVKTSIALGKLYEELGFVGKALDIYRLGSTQEEPSLIYFKKKIQIQLLRLYSFLEMRADAEKLYHFCLNTDYPVDLHCELEHGLMLAELFLIGVDTAEVRLKNSLENSQFSQVDQNLLIFDFIESVVIKHPGLNLDALLAQTSARPLVDIFEKTIHRLIGDKKTGLSLVEIMSLSHQMSPLSYLKILHINFMIKESPNKLEQIKKIKSLLSFLDKKSKNLLEKKMIFDRAINIEKSEIRVDNALKQINYNSRSLDLDKKELALKALNLLSENKSIDIYDFIPQIYGIDFDQNSYDRCRMVIKRLNNDLFKITGRPRVIGLNGKKVSSSIHIIKIN